MQQDNELVLPLEAGAFYEFSVSVYYVPAASNALGFQMSGPPGSTALWNALGHFENSSFGSMPLATSNISSILITSFSASALTLLIQGVVQNGGTAGDLSFNWTPTVGNNMTVVAGSTIRADKHAP